MARYGANELFNPGGRRRKKTGQAGVVTGDQGASMGSMPHSQAPDALGMLTQAISLGKDIKEGFTKDKTTTDTDTDKKNGNGFKKLEDPDLNTNGNNANGSKNKKKKNGSRFSGFGGVDY